MLQCRLWQLHLHVHPLHGQVQMIAIMHHVCQRQVHVTKVLQLVYQLLTMPLAL